MNVSFKSIQKISFFKHCIHYILYYLSLSNRKISHVWGKIKKNVSKHALSFLTLFPKAVPNKCT